MDILLDNNHDIDLSTNELQLTSGIDAIAQDLEIALSFFLGEWFLDTRLGVPYFQKIIGQKPRLNVIREIYRKACLQVNGVKSIFDLTLDFDRPTRKLFVSLRAGTIDGVISYTKELIV